VSLRRQHPWMVNNISARMLFWAGMLILPAYLLQSNLIIRLVQVVFFGVLTTVAGKRLQWFYFLTIIVTITVFHLLVPSGVVIATVNGFRITLGALRTGLFKAVTIVGLVFISLVSVRADLRLPGRLGSLAGKMFWSFEQIMERRGELEARRPFVSGDRLLFSLYDGLAMMDESHARTAERKATASVSSPAGRAVVLLAVGAQWLLLAAPSL
jgi:signal transduction histidine kinase